LLLNLRRKIGALGLKKTVTTFAKIMVASLLMGLIAWLIYKVLVLKIVEEFALVLAIIIAALVYFIVILMFRIEEVDNMIKLIRGKLKAMLS
jgi:putative peptidoglycan lipid II flippase